MSWLTPLVVAVPLAAAAVIVGGDHLAPRVVKTLIGVVGSGATFGLSVALMLEAQTRDVVHWFGGWHPRGGLAIGIDFTADPLGAGMCVLASGVVFVGLLYAWAYMPDAPKLFDALMLVCGAGMCGFALSGDLFNLFVWLELMGVAGFALTGFEISRLGPLQGAINFAVINTLGGYLVVLGIALLYAHTGALNLAQLGEVLARHPAGGLVIVAFTVIVCGFLCKAAVVPFHLWLADAYAVAPVPVALVLAGAMTDVGLLGVARVYWTVFSGAVHADERFVGDLFLWLGITSALLGGVMAFLQRHLKRMLAYSVICHTGIMLAGIGLLSSAGLAGTAALLVAHGLLTGGLFLASGVVLVRLASVDELTLRGRGRSCAWLGVVWAAGALGLAGPPYLGVYLGHALIDDAAVALGRHWVQPLLWVAGALATAALLRAAARIFLGWGGAEDALLSPEKDAEPPKACTAVLPLAALAALLVALGLAVSVAPGLAERAEHGAERFRDRAAYAGRVLHDEPGAPARRLPFAVESGSRENLVYAAGATVLAVGLAGLGLRRRGRLGILEPVVSGLRQVHSGIVGDYVMWLTVGTAVIGGVWAITLR